MSSPVGGTNFADACRLQRADTASRSSAVMKFIVAATMLCFLIATAANAGRTSRWGPSYFPNTLVTDQNGKTYHFYDDLLKDKIVAINFIYTSCADICPLMTARMAEVERRLGKTAGSEVFFYSISLDPARDTPEALKAHADAFGARWLFLTGKPNELALLRHKLGERSRRLSEHRVDIMLGNDRTRQWHRTSTMLDFGRIVLAIREMDPAWRKQQAQVRTRPKGSNYASMAKRFASTGQRGQALYRKACSVCHSIGHGDRVGPDLKDVEGRRDSEWLTKFIMTPGVLRKAKDPQALDLAKRFPGRTMPYLGLSKTDVADVLSYIDAKSKRFATKAKARAAADRTILGR